MKSIKPVKNLEDVVLPFLFSPSVTVQGSVNGKGFYYQQGKSYEISFAEYEAIWHSSYGKELEN